MYLVNFSTLAALLLLTTFLGCSIGQTTLTPRNAQKKNSSGWVESSTGERKGSDTYFFKVNVAADPSFTNGAKKEFSCKFAALEEGKLQAPVKLTDEFNSNRGLIQNDINFVVKDVKAKECRATGKYDSNSPFSEWSHCECLITVKVDSGQKINQFAKSF